MPDTSTLNGNLLLNTNPTAPAQVLSVSRTDVSAANPLASISLSGVTGGSLPGVVSFSTGTGSAAPQERMRLHSNGSLGIGTAQPADNTRLNVVGGAIAVGSAPHRADASLHVNGSFGGFDRLLQMSPVGNSKAGLNLLASRGPAAEEQWWAWGVTADNQWNISPGTGLNPQSGLTIAPTGSVAVSGDIAVGGKHALRGNDAWLRLNQDAAFTSGVHTPGNFAPGALNVGGAGSYGNPGPGNAWVAGSVGVGTITPRRRLHVHSDSWGDGTAGAEIHASGATAGFSFTDRQVGLQMENNVAGDRWVLYSQGRTARLWTNGVGDRFTVGADGNISIQGDMLLQANHTIRCNGRMHVTGEELLYLLNKSGVSISKAWGGTGDLTVEGNQRLLGSLNLDGDVQAGTWVAARGAGNEQAYIGGDGVGGDVQIGSMNPAITNVGFWNTATGRFMSTRAASFVQSSDARLKSNVEPLTGALGRIAQMQGVQFDWAHETDKGADEVAGRQIGLIAQDVMRAVPEVVSQDANGHYGIAYGSLVAVLIEAVKEQQQRIEALEDRCKAMVASARP